MLVPRQLDSRHNVPIGRGWRQAQAPARVEVTQKSFVRARMRPRATAEVKARPART